MYSCSCIVQSRLMCNNAADTPKPTPTSEHYPYPSQESYAQHVEVVATELLLSDERAPVDVREVVPLRDGRVILLDAGNQSVKELHLLNHRSCELYRSPDRAVRDDIFKLCKSEHFKTDAAHGSLNSTLFASSSGLCVPSERLFFRLATHSHRSHSRRHRCVRRRR